MDTTKRATCWSLTINNPSNADEEEIAIARQKGWKVEGQKEKGENGTVHYQLCLKTPQLRFSAIKKAFTRAHIEIARNQTALEQYVVKEETREGVLQTAQTMYPSMQTAWDMFSHFVYNNDGGVHARESGIQQWDGERWLSEFDVWVRFAIEKGYVVEGIAVNPQTRSSIKNYAWSIYTRSCTRGFNGYTGPQTDSQTDRQDTEDGLKNKNVDNTQNADEDEENIQKVCF